jgi:hypothetical protein
MMRAAIAFLLLVTGAAGVASPATAQESGTTQAPAKPATSKQAAPKQPAGKQTTPKQAQAPRPPSGPCIGVLSRLGETFTLRRVGITAFGNEENPVPIDAWRIDDLVAARIAAFVNKRAAVRRITYPPGTFASLDTPQLFRNDTKAFDEIARPLLAATHCARYVAVIPFSASYNNTNQLLKGLGILWPSGLVDRFYLYANAELRVYDENLAVLDHKYVSLAPRENRFLASLTAGPVRGPHREVDKSFWPNPAGVAQNAMLREAMRDLVARSLDATLPELKLMD